MKKVEINEIIEIENQKYRVESSDNEVDLILVPLDDEGKPLEVTEVL